MSIESRTFKPLPVAFVFSEIEGTEEENRFSEASNTANMSSGTRSNSDFNMSDVMSKIQAKMEVKTKAGKPPMPRVEGSSSGVKLKKEVTKKKRKLEDVEALDKAKKEGWTAKKGKESFMGLFNKAADLMDFLRLIWRLGMTISIY